MSDVTGDAPTVAAESGDPFDGSGGDAVIAGRIAERWDILALIGTGGMGNVYRAHDRELGEDVALKVLRRGQGVTLDRFRHEVRLARRVTHVNVARTHDIGNHGDTVFLTMELIDGEPLSRRIGHGPLRWRDAVAIGRGICAGVGAAHAAGVVHRDLKPDNVMLAGDGRVVVTDFGIARASEVARGDRTIVVTGTPTWMAPEQLAGQADARSDVYAIGEMLWAMLAGAHPWTADGKIQVVARIGAAAPGLDRDLVPAAVADVVERCLTPDPAGRFGDAGALGAALAAAEAAGETGAGTVRPAPAAEPRSEVRVGVDAIKNLGDPADDFVAAGLVEDLIDVLGRARGIKVRALETGAGKDDLDVVVGGSLRRAGEQVRIAVRASGARDGFQIWSQRFDRRLDEILKLTDEVARDVATALSATAARGAVGRDVATDQFVVELYLRARHLLEKTWVDDPRPLALYEAALARDPDSPIVLAAYASLLARRLNPDDGGAAGRGGAERAARRAIEHGGDLPEPWVALAVVRNLQGRGADAVRAVRLALERGPGHADAADQAGRLLCELDPVLDEATALLERAHWTNPRLPFTVVDLVRAYALRGEWPRVDELLGDPGAEQAPPLQVARARMALWRGDRMAGGAASVPGVGRFAWATEAVTEVLERGTLSPGAAAAWRAGLTTFPAGSRLRRLFAQIGAEAALRVGAIDEAWPFLDEAVAQGLIDTAWLERLPLLEPLRADPRFAAVRATVAPRGEPLLAAWRGPLPSADVDAW
jgi:eukaryotic-like serine/threonine-protein kinase